MPISNATLDRLLAVLLLAVGATGLTTLRAGTADSSWLYVAHGLLAGALAASVSLKLRRSVPGAVRRSHVVRLILGLTLTTAVAASILAGYAWVASGSIPTLGTMTILTLHAVIGLVAAPIVALHLLPRRWRLLTPSATARAPLPPWPASRSLTRRSVLVAGSLAAVSGAFWLGAGWLERLSGGERRFTGSRWLPRGGIPPTTTFYGEPAPALDPQTWRLDVTGRVDRPKSFSLDELMGLGETDLTAVLDCTGGWAVETDWHGVTTASLLDAVGVRPGARLVEIRSVTGWTGRFDIAAARRTLLATGVAGVKLPFANGAPLRLVVPDRRGLDWVKWVAEVRVS
jgi:hypothetical protein